MKGFKYISNIVEDSTYPYAEIRLYDEIGFDGIDGAAFAYELNYLVEHLYPKFEEVKVRINSIGGSVIQGFSIFSAIYNAIKNGHNVTTHNDGVAASIAGVILLAGKPPKVKDYSRLMVHGVSLLDADGNPVAGVSENDLAMMENAEDMILTAITNSTGIKKAKIKKLLTNGKDNWFNAEEGAKFGFYPAENIENTGVDLPAENNALIIANKARKIIENSINSKPFKMKRLTALLNLQEGSTEDVVANAVKTAIDNAKVSSEALNKAKTTITEKDEEIKKLKASVEASNKMVATSEVEAAIKEGKLSPKDDTEKESIVNQAVKDPAGFKTMLSMIPTKAANIINQTQAGKENPSTLIEKVANRSFRQLEKEDPSLLADIKNSAKSEYVKLYNKQYNTEKTEADFA